MFDQSFVDGDPKAHKLRAVGSSLLLQSVLVGAGILAPLVYTETLPTAQLKGLFVGPPPPAAPSKAQAAIKTRAVAPHTFSFSKLVAPRAAPRRLNSAEVMEPAPEVGVPGGTGGSEPAINPLLWTVPNATPPPPPAAIAKPANSRGPVRIGGVVAEANLTREVQPVYPALAKLAHIEGTVAFAAVIDQEGRVEHLELLSGPALLVAAARDAILQWRYRPTLLNGQPVEVSTTITVHFTLNR